MGNSQIYQAKTYTELKENILPLDIIYDSYPGILSDVIKISQCICDPNHNGQWIHAGAVVYNIKFTNKLGLPDNEIGVINGEEGGVSIFELSDEIKSKTGTFAYCRLLNNPFIRLSDETDKDYNERIQQLYIKIDNFCNKHKGDQYDYLWHLPVAVMPCLSCIIKPSKNHVFCSELVAMLYQEMGLINKFIDPETISPGDLLEYNPYAPPIIIINK